MERHILKYFMMKKSFLVDAGVYTVKVLGTKFNVEAYPGIFALIQA